jgi:hypothetical protein
MADEKDDLAAAARRISDLRTIVAGLLTLLVIAFTGGIFWNRLTDYEHKVDDQSSQIIGVQKDLSDQIKGVQKDLNRLKIHLGDLGERSYPEEVTNNNDPHGVRCEPGNVVTGMKIEENRTFIYCTSLGRAAWNPGSQANEESK